MSLTVTQWKNTNLVPMAGLIAWHQFEQDHSGNNLATDYSGNGRDLTCAAGGSPYLIANTIGGQTAWYFDGTANPLTTSVAMLPIPAVKHVYILASADETAFVSYRGLLSGATTGDVLTSNPTGNIFFDFGLGTNFVYRKNDVSFPNSALNAPVGGVFGLLEVQSPTGLTLDGIQIGQHKSLTARKWKGFFVEQVIYDRVLTEAERQRLIFYFALKYSLYRSSVLPVYFPSDDFMNFRRRRFYAEPPDFEKITDSFEFEDGGKTFNEVSLAAPLRWEYNYELVNPSGGTDPGEVKIFDEFNDRMRLANPFNFRDKYGTVWTNVRIENYARTHQNNKPWRQAVKFRLIKYPN